MEVLRQQVVPQRSFEDEDRISQIAMMLQNPSPSFPKTFDLSRSDSFSNFNAFQSLPNGLFSPNFSDLLMQNATPSIQASSVSPFAISASATAFIGSDISGTPTGTPMPQSAPVAPAAPAASNSTAQMSSPISSQDTGASSHASQASASPATVPTVTVPTSTRRKRAKSESEESDLSEEEEEDSHESNDEDEDLSDQDSDGSYHKAAAAKRRKRKAPQPLSSNARCFADLTDDDIAFMDFKDLTRMMVQAGLNRAAVAEVKARRRRLKNRQSARLCSNKKREMCQELATEKSKLQDQITSLQQAYNKLQREHTHLKQQYELLQRQGR